MALDVVDASHPYSLWVFLACTSFRPHAMVFYLEDRPRQPLGVLIPMVRAYGSTLLRVRLRLTRSPTLSAGRRADLLLVPVRAVFRTCTLGVRRETTLCHDGAS